MAAAKEGSSDRIDQIEERLLAHKWVTSMCCSVIAIFVLLPVYAERVAEPADANAGTGCWVVSAYTVNAARPGGGVYREWFQGWDEAPEWRSDDAVMPPCCQSRSTQSSLFVPYHESFPDKGWWGDGYGPRNATIHHLWLCEEDDACANCAGDVFTVEAATCAAGRCESRATNGSCACDRAYEDTQGGGGRWACDDVRGCRWRRDFVVGLAGPPQDVMSWWAQDEDFAILYALYLLAVAASAFGVAASLLIRRDFRRSEEAASTTPFRAYLKALVAYFVIQLFANLAAFLGFTTWRCEHQRADDARLRLRLQKSEPDCGGYRRRRVGVDERLPGLVRGRPRIVFEKLAPRLRRRAVWKSFLGDDAAVLAPSSGDEPAAPRHRAGVASMAWRSTRRLSMKAP